MSAELYAALGGLALIVLGLLGTVLRAWGEKLLAELKTNTRETRAAKTAAEKVVDQVNWQQKYTSVELENDDLRRKLALVEGLPDCLDCRVKIRAVLNETPAWRRRTDPPQEPAP